MQGRLYPVNDGEIARCNTMGICDCKRILALEDLVKGDEVYFAATGVSDGDLLKGVVNYKNDIAKTQSVVMRAKTGTIRFVDTTHNLSKNKR